MLKVDLTIVYKDDIRYTLPNYLIITEHDANAIRQYIKDRSNSSTVKGFNIPWLPDHLFNLKIKRIIFTNVFDNKEVYRSGEDYENGEQQSSENESSENESHDEEPKYEEPELSPNGKYVAKKYMQKLEIRNAAPERIRKLAEAINKCENGAVGEEYDNSDVRKFASLPNVSDDEILKARQLYYSAY